MKDVMLIFKDTHCMLKEFNVLQMIEVHIKRRAVYDVLECSMCNIDME